ncbi:hypothetical protein LTR15_011438 [Elasticomyces elasticus]|nr:hypothetical protein LTR15_011438 [Elasticomyces elasticus]
MSPSMNGTRGGTQTPPNIRQNGGVALPNGSRPEESERATNSSTRLSADASTFRPSSGMPAPISLLNRHSEADTTEHVAAPCHPVIVSSTVATNTNGGEQVRTNVQQPIGTRSTTDTPPPATVYFTTDVGPEVEFQGGHYIRLDNLTKEDLTNWLEIMSDTDTQANLLGSKITQDGNRYVYYCCFDDTRQAHHAVDYIEMSQLGLSFQYISQTEYAGAQDRTNNAHKTAFHDGQVIFAASFLGATMDFNAKDAIKAVHDLAGSFGGVRAFAPVPGIPFPRLEYRAEYYAISNAMNALAAATKESPKVVNNWQVVASEVGDYNTQSTGSNGDAAVITNGMTGIRIVDTPPPNGEMFDRGNYASPTGRTTWSVDENGNEMAMQPLHVPPKVGSIMPGVPILSTPHHRSRYHSAPTPHTPGHFIQGAILQPRNDSWHGYDSRYSYSYNSPTRSPIPGPQTVEVWKIENGQDVRTTVMLRNIPNRMSCHDLKRVLDENCHGNYDFSYLRIDFEKGTNVGYAFVNFAEPQHIVPFVNEHAGRRWQSDNPRCVELSYATVQGYDCLVEKFRNSAIMSEYKDYRPKLFYTFMNAPTDAAVGTEMTFPAANNISKKQRSLDNAGQIGLYAPRSGHMSRERGRHSQFDRGTTMSNEMDRRQQYQNTPTHNGHHSHGSYGSSGYGSNGGYGNNYGYGSNGYNNNGYNVPRLPPPPFQPMFDPSMAQFNGFTNPFMGGNPMIQGYGSFDNGDVFGPHYNGGFNNGGFNGGFNNGGYNNGYHRGGHQQFGVGPGTPASRLRTHTNGRLGGRNHNVTTVGGPVQPPNGSYSNGHRSPDGYYQPQMPAVVEGDDEAGAFNNNPYNYPLH